MPDIEADIAKGGDFKTIEGNLYVTGRISGVYDKGQTDVGITSSINNYVTEYQNKEERTFRVGEVVQKGYGRASVGGGWQNFTAVVSNGTNWSTSDNDFGQRMVEISPIRVTITPLFADSLIAIHWNVFGEPSDHNTGFKIAELVNGVPTIIRRSGYEGYNAQFSVVEYNHYIADFYDGDSDTTGRMSNFVYFDKPNSTDERTYTVMFGANGNTANIYTLNRTYNGTGTNDEVGVTTWWWEEIKQ